MYYCKISRLSFDDYEQQGDDAKREVRVEKEKTNERKRQKKRRTKK